MELKQGILPVRKQKRNVWSAVGLGFSSAGKLAASLASRVRLRCGGRIPQVALLAWLFGVLWALSHPHQLCGTRLGSFIPALCVWGATHSGAVLSKPSAKKVGGNCRKPGKSCLKDWKSLKTALFWAGGSGELLQPWLKKDFHSCHPLLSTAACSFNFLY